ncbi:MAG TPA: indole-3-glycerol phosphate synthase TrpC [Terriglobales bacterium]
MANRLDQIVAQVRRRVSERRDGADVRDLERRAAEHRPRGFRQALRGRAKDGVAVIAELKKASPSRGLIRADFDPGSLARQMTRAGAAALSVLTEEDFFQGSLENLKIVSAASHLPCLRKDFIVDELQIIEARAYCADAVLLIVAALSPTELGRLVQRSSESELDVLCEVHDEAELTRALDAGCTLIGVNSRDLRSFDVDLNTAVRVGKLIPKHVVSVAESGIHSGQDIQRLRAEGYQAFLIGELLMKAEKPGQALRTVLVEARTTVPSF